MEKGAADLHGSNVKNMREYNYDGEDREVDNFWKDGDEMEEYEENEDDEDNFLGYSKQEIIRAMELELGEKQIDLELLRAAMRFNETSFWWRFYGFQTRLKMIAKSYLIFRKLTKPDKEEEEEEESEEEN